MFRWDRICAICLCTLMVSTTLTRRSEAQSETGTITGTVVDASGGAIPGATVTVTGETTGVTRSVTSSSDGNFAFFSVLPGTYTVRVERRGFKRFERLHIVLTANQRLPLGRIQLSIGAVTQTVTVSSQGEVANTESGENSSLLSGKQLDLSIARGRDVINLLKILPGVSQITSNGSGSEVAESNPGIGDSTPGGEYGTYAPNVAGTRSYWNTMMLDGQPADTTGIRSLYADVLSMDSIAEVKVTENDYSAEFGRNPGATINIITKSGTKNFHGNLYWENRNKTFVANDFFNNRNGVAKPAYSFNNFGGTIGGPVYLPGHFNKDRSKLFFFFSTDYWNITQPSGLYQYTVPTAMQRQGDFSQTFDQTGKLIPIVNPATGQQFAGNVIPTGDINLSSQALLNVFPLPNELNTSITKGVYNYQWQDIPQQQKVGQLLRFDYNPTQRDTLTLRLTRWNSDILEYVNGNVGFNELPLVKVGYRFSMDNALLGDTHILSPTAVNEFNVGLRGEKELPSNLGGGAIFTPVTRSHVGFDVGQLYPSDNPRNFIPEALFGGIPDAASLTYDSRLPINTSMGYFSLADVLSYERAPHSLKFGIYIERDAHVYGHRSIGSPSGEFDFSNNANNPGNAGWPYATALLGNFTSYSESDSQDSGPGHILSVEWFGQDTWKLGRKLTLNYGARFTIPTPWIVDDGADGASFVLSAYSVSQSPPLYAPVLGPNRSRMAKNPVTGAIAPAALIGAFVPGVGNPFSGMILGSNSSYPSGFTRFQSVAVAPRFGFAYDVFGNGSTAIRGGFGSVREAVPSNNVYLSLTTTNPPIEITPEIFYSNMNKFLNSQGVLFPESVSGMQPRMQTPTVYEYSFGVERRINLNTLLDVSYVGNSGQHLFQSQNLNTLPYGARFLPQNTDPTKPGTPLPDTFFSPYAGYGAINYLESSGISNYNSLQVSATRRFTKGLQFGLAYTWSKTMDLTDGEGTPGSATQVALYVPRSVWNYGLAGFDQSQQFVFNYVWPLPRASSLVPGKFVRGLFDNWEISGIATFATGLPQGINLSTVSGQDRTGGGDGIRVNVTGAAQLPRGDRSFSKWFNTEAFALPPVGSPGDASKAVFRGPGINNWDISLIKNFPLWSDVRSLQFRCDMYNAFNHTQFDAVDNNAIFNAAGQQTNGEFGQVTSTRPPRAIQFTLKLYF